MAHLGVDLDRDVIDRPDAHFADAGPGVHRDRRRRHAVDRHLDVADHDVLAAIARRAVADADVLVADQRRRLDADAGGLPGGEPGAGEQRGGHDQPPRPPGERADEQAATAHHGGGAEPLLGMQPPAVRLIDQGADGGDDEGDAERQPPEDGHRTRRPVRQPRRAGGAPPWSRRRRAPRCLRRRPSRRRRRRPTAPWPPRPAGRPGPLWRPGAGCQRATARPTRRASTATGAGEEVEALGQHERHAGHEHRAAGEAGPAPVVLGAVDQRQPERAVHDHADAADERQQHERDAHPQGVDTEPIGEQRGHTQQQARRLGVLRARRPAVAATGRARQGPAGRGPRRRRYGPAASGTIGEDPERSPSGRAHEPGGPRWSSGTGRERLWCALVPRSPARAPRLGPRPRRRGQRMGQPVGRRAHGGAGRGRAADPRRRVSASSSTAAPRSCPPTASRSRPGCCAPGTGGDASWRSAAPSAPRSSPAGPSGCGRATASCCPPSPSPSASRSSGRSVVAPARPSEA